MRVFFVHTYEEEKELKKIILASASPRRKEILEQIGMQFEILVSDKEEIYESSRPEEIVKELSLLKADHVSEMVEKKDIIVIGADTIVAHEGKVLGKPKNRAEAFEMIKSIQGKVHKVYTGVAILCYDESGNKKTINDAVETKVFVYPMSEKEINNYLDTGEYMDKAGAYAMQGQFAPFIEKIEGDYYNVVVLPVAYIYQAIKS